MNRETLDRVLRLVRREMGCQNARLELGGDPPDSAEVLCAQMPGGFRLVAVFQEAPADRSSANLRLRQLAATFFETELKAPEPRADAENHLLHRRLDDELYGLASRTSASGALIVDLKSPIVWGCSEGRPQVEDLDEIIMDGELEEIARRRGIDLSIVGGLIETEQQTILESFAPDARPRMERLLTRLQGRTLRARRTHLLRARTLLDVRAWMDSPEIAAHSSGTLRHAVHGDGVGYLGRSFAGIYVLVLYFGGTFSELHAEAALLHALPTIESMVLALPPVDPPPRKGQVVLMRRS